MALVSTAVGGWAGADPPCLDERAGTATRDEVAPPLPPTASRARPSSAATVSAYTLLSGRLTGASARALSAGAARDAGAAMADVASSSSCIDSSAARSSSKMDRTLPRRAPGVAAIKYRGEGGTGVCRETKLLKRS
jgi:hypothetical protein